MKLSYPATMLCEPRAPVERNHVPFTKVSWLSRFSFVQTPQKYGEL